MELMLIVNAKERQLVCLCDSVHSDVMMPLIRPFSWNWGYWFQFRERRRSDCEMPILWPVSYNWEGTLAINGRTVLDEWLNGDIGEALAKKLFIFTLLCYLDIESNGSKHSWLRF